MLCYDIDDFVKEQCVGQNKSFLVGMRSTPILRQNFVYRKKKEKKRKEIVALLTNSHVCHWSLSIFPVTSGSLIFTWDMEKDR